MDAGYNNPLLQKKPKTIYECVRIADIAATYNGGTPSKANPLYWGGTIPWVSPKDFSNLEIDDSEDHITDKAFAESGLRILKPGTVLIVYRSGVLQHSLPVAVARANLTINQDIKALLLDERILPEYLVLYFHVFGQRLLPIITKHSTTVQSINSEQFNALVIPLPPLPVQKEIVGEMEQARESRRRKLTEAEALLDGLDAFLLERIGLSPTKALFSRFYAARLKESRVRCDPDYHSPKFKELRRAIDASHHPVYDLGTLAPNPRTGFAAGREVQSFDEEEGIPHVRPLNITRHGELTFEGTKLVPRNSVQPKDKLQPDEVLLNNTNSTEWVGKTTVFEGQRGCCCSNHITRLTPDRSLVLPWFLAALLNAMRSTGYLGLLATNFVNQAGINTETLCALRLPTPSLDKQQEIVAELTRRRMEARRLREEAKQEWEAAKDHFEARLLGERNS